MNEDDILEEALKDPEVVKAGEGLKDAVWARTPNSKCFNMTPIEAFQLCAEAFTRMKERGEIASEQMDKFRTVVTGSSTTDDTIKDAQGNVINKIVEPSPTGRRAAIEHTKRKIRDE